MILANICAAEEIETKGQPCVYRTHDRPDMEKIDGIYELADALSIPFAKGQVITPHIFNKLLDGVKGKPEEQMVNDAVLRYKRALFTIIKIKVTMAYRLQNMPISPRPFVVMQTY